jgi:hypothetical protein
MGSAIRSPSGAKACIDASEQTMTLNAESTPLQQDGLDGKDCRHSTLLPRERVAAAEAEAVAFVKDTTAGVAPHS